MLDRMLMTFMEGAVICLGIPFLLKLSTSKLMFGSWIIEFMKLHFWRCAVSDKVPLKKPAGDMVETEQVSRIDLVRCFELQTKSVTHIQKHCAFVPDHTNNALLQYMWCRSLMNKAKSKNYQLENCVPILMHSLKGSGPANIASFPYSKVKGQSHHLSQHSFFSSNAQEKHRWNLTKMSNHILKDKFGYSENSEIIMEEDFKVQPVEMFPSDMSDINELTSVSDCVYNQQGQLVRMFICFDSEHSDASSVVTSSDSDCNTWDSDCEDFIVFENSCTDENDCCTRLDFVCGAGDLRKETCAKSVVLTSNLYCEVSMMESFDTKLDSFVHEILQPNLCYSCGKFILNRTSCKDVKCKISVDLISTNTTGKTTSKQRSKKKVHFKPDNQLVVIYPMVVWNFAYKHARKGTWEADALDRLRFQKRVKELDEILTPVLLAKKEKVF